VQYRELLQLVMHILNKPTSEVSICSLSVQPLSISLSPKISSPVNTC
jgi:hypothetical protein